MAIRPVYDPETGGSKPDAPDAPDKVDAPDAPDKPDAPDRPDATMAALPNGWRGPIAKLDGATGDGRWLATPPDGVRTRAYPLSLTNRHVGDPMGYPTIGSLDRAWAPGDGLLYGEGKLDIGGDEGAEYARQLAAGMGNMVSIDPDQVTAENRIKGPNGEDFTDQFLAAYEAHTAGLAENELPQDADPSTFEYGDQWPPTAPDGSGPVETNTVMQFSDWRLSGLAACPISAYTEARIEPVFDYTPSQALPTDAIVSATNVPRDIVIGMPEGRDISATPVDGDDPEQLPNTCMCDACGCGGEGTNGMCCMMASQALPADAVVSAAPLGTGDTSPTGALNPSMQQPGITLPNNGDTDDVSMPVVRTTTGGAFQNSSMIALRPARPRTFATPSKAAHSPEDLHVTLAYLGDGRHSDEVHQAGHKAAHAAAAALADNPSVTVSGYGHLGNPENPATVLFLNGKGIADAHAAASAHLAEHVASGAIPEQHPNHIPHMTLGYGVPLAHAKMFMGRKFALDGASYDNQNTSYHFDARTAQEHNAARSSKVAPDHGNRTLGPARNGGDNYTTSTHRQGDAGGGGHIVAAVGGQVFHREFFEARADGPTPVTITEDGHFFGHVRLKNTCYQYGGNQGNGGKCVQPPPSGCAYAKFMVHGAKMDDGSIMPVGAITFGDGHVSRGGLEASRKHYDDVATVAAKVFAMDDAWGTWVTGEILADYADRAYDLMLAPLSGHWEPDADNRNRLEMLAAHIVVTPGYAVPRIVASFDEEENVTSLFLTEDFQYLATEPEDDSMPTTRADVLKALADIERGKALAAKLGIDVPAVLAARAEAIVAAGGGMPIADPDTAWDGGAAGGRILDRATSGDKIDVGMAGQGFLAHVGDGSKRGDWKLPFADVHGGGLSIIPRGVSAAAGRLNQTQGIDQAAAKSKIDGLYSRIHAKYPDWAASPDA